ncbi:tetratricopeptide repeat protein [Nitrosomonas sp. Is37]|uniref:tetratricopeptide repeat protein n=1 Tax=Nitrosomonas sp. Is37 TaxID=3080535 RepID=UPI00294AED5E|nr:tetratricopeptide repeat protein [Nitrosomonas sp. Is37]MDV6343378.1 tetratricopeptide repeat protein [Nitrosomonas sp. Is37]
MFNLKQLLGILTCLFLLAGCASQQNKNQLESTGSTGNGGKVSQQITHDLEAMYQSGRTYQEEASFPEAITTYENILAIDPDYAEAYNGLGVIYAIQEKFEPALLHLQKAITLEPLASHLHNNLGYTYLLMGREAEAIRSFKQALRLDPGNQKARANLTAIHYKNRTDTTSTTRE